MVLIFLSFFLFSRYWVNFLLKKRFKKVFKNKEEFYQEEFYNNPAVAELMKNQTDKRVVLNVPLSSLWLGSLDELIQNLNEQLKIKIPTEKAKWLINTWVEHNKKFL